MTLLEEIIAKCTPEEIAARGKDGGLDIIAAKVSAGRMRAAPTEAGNGTILETLGIAAGNKLLDVIYNVPDFRYVKPLVEQGRLRLDTALVQATLDSLVPSVITQAQADALKARCMVPDPVSPQQCSAALEGI